MHYYKHSHDIFIQDVDLGCKWIIYSIHCNVCFSKSVYYVNAQPCQLLLTIITHNISKAHVFVTVIICYAVPCPILLMNGELCLSRKQIFKELIKKLIKKWTKLILHVSV